MLVCWYNMKQFGINGRLLLSPENSQVYLINPQDPRYNKLGAIRVQGFEVYMNNQKA